LKKNRISKNWLIKKHKDQFFKQSKIQGYRSRSAFKLIEMNQKFKFLNQNTCLLDLGSSPGGWAQVAAKKITKGKILAVDIKPMESVNKVNFLKGDLLDPEIYEKIYAYFNKKIDVVICDMATNTSGNKNLDSYKMGELCLKGMDLAQKILHQDGVFLSKLFMGSIFMEIHKKANKYFKKVVKYKPLSSRKESKEIYIYCKGISKSFTLPRHDT
jgi:23S rRNA (uridine2552-2'-O)-methyltransferase